MIKRLATLTALAFAAVPGVAQACVQPATSEPFARFGDTADYWLAPGGGMESGGAAWTLSGASVVNDTDRVLLNGAPDSHALAIQPGGQAVSGAFCVDQSNPSLRLYVRKPNGTGTLRVDLLVTTADGRSLQGYAGTINQNGETGWTPSPVLDLAAALPPGQVAKGDLSVQLRFSASADAGAWSIDDLYIDPFRFD